MKSKLICNSRPLYPRSYQSAWRSMKSSTNDSMGESDLTNDSSPPVQCIVGVFPLCQRKLWSWICCSTPSH